MKKKNGVDKRGGAITEIENLTDLLERERGSVTILLAAAASDNQLDGDDIHSVMKDSYDRVEKMEESLKHIEQLVR